MNEIRRVLKAAAWRLLVIDLFRTLAVTLSAAVGTLIAVLLVQRIFGLELRWPGDWSWLFAAAAGGAVVAALAWSTLRRARGVAVARELDERANLRESLSTALCVASSEDPWAKAVVETARQRAVGVKVGQAIPIAAPRLWPVPFAMMLTLVILWFSVPNFDVLGLLKKREVAQKQQDEIKTVASEVKKDEQKLQDLLQKAKVEFKDEKGDKDSAENKPSTPDEIRRAAVKKLTALTDKLNDAKAGEKPKQLEALKQAMKQLKQPGPGPLDKLTNALQKGDFSQAQKELADMAQKMASNQMSPEDKQKAGEQMQKLADQLQKLAKSTEEMQKKLEQAGLSKEAAKAAAQNPEAMKKAMEQLKNLSEQQKQELMKQMAAKESACKSCNGMSESMSKMSKGMGKSGMSQEGQQAMEAMGNQLSEMEMLSKDMEGMEAALSECQSQLCKMSQCMKPGNCEKDGELQFKECASPWKAGDSNKQGGGRGGPGQSGGSGKGAEEETGVNVTKRMTPTKQKDGPIIGQTMVQGDQVRGESVLAFQEAVESSAKAATEAIDAMTVPRELHPAVKHYFGRLEAKAKARSVEAPAAPATPPAAAPSGK